MTSDELHDVTEAVRRVQIERALDDGDHDAIIAEALDVGFAGDGLGVQPWVQGDVIVCPGALVSMSRSSHRCRFVSVDDARVWDSGLPLREDMRSSPGAKDGFRAIALLPVLDAPRTTWSRGELVRRDTPSTRSRRTKSVTASRSRSADARSRHATCGEGGRG